MEQRSDDEDSTPQPASERKLSPHLRFIEKEFLKPTSRNTNARNNRLVCTEAPDDAAR